MGVRQFGWRCQIERKTSLEDALLRAQEFEAITVVLDIEPLVSPWNGTQSDLDAGLAEAISAARKHLPRAQLLFVTNSKRAPRQGLGHGKLLRYLHNGRKPWLCHGLDSVRGPLVVIGDQVLTDGMLAWRLRHRPALFLYVSPRDPQPLWARLQGLLGVPVRALGFHRG